MLVIASTRSLLLCAACSIAIACGDGSPEPTAARDAGVALDATASTDAGHRDGGVRDSGPRDAGTRDAGHRDAGVLAPPPALVRYHTGDEADRDVTPQGPALVMMGGSREVDAAFEWWRPRVAGGDVVILRTSGSDGYNDYLFSDIGGVDSVETMLVTTRALASDPYVAWRVATAEGIFLAGGDQSTYLESWKDTPLETAFMTAWARGAVVGGTSAGLAVLGDNVFAAYAGSVTSAEALADPYDTSVTLEPDFLALAPLAGVITDSHFGRRDRMGRLVTFVARWFADGATGPLLGLGIDERTAVVVDDAGEATVMGSGAVYIVYGAAPAARCAPGRTLDYADVAYATLRDGDTFTLPSGATTVTTQTLDVVDGVLSPADPY